MWLNIIEGVFAAFPILAKWFPGKTDEERAQEVEAKSAVESKKMQESGRP